MKIKMRNRANPSFSLSSMTDIVFLLLIFFILSSEISQQRTLDLILPKAEGHKPQTAMPTIRITQQLVFYINHEAINKSALEAAIQQSLEKKDEKQFLIQADRQVPIQEVVFVLDIANRNNYKAHLATEVYQ